MNPAQRLGLLAALVVLLLVPSALRAADARRPNFILIITDDQRYDAMGVVQAEQGERGRFPWF